MIIYFFVICTTIRNRSGGVVGRGTTPPGGSRGCAGAAGSRAPPLAKVPLNGYQQHTLAEPVCKGSMCRIHPAHGFPATVRWAEKRISGGHLLYVNMAAAVLLHTSPLIHRTYAAVSSTHLYAKVFLLLCQRPERATDEPPRNSCYSARLSHGVLTVAVGTVHCPQRPRLQSR